MPASIEDVAKLANVSISTVSRVINRRQLVNEATCKRVEAAIRELRYRPNVFARGLMLRKSGIVGLVLPDLHGEFYSEIIRGANLQAREMQHNLLLSSALPGDDAQSWLAAIGERGTDRRPGGDGLRHDGGRHRRRRSAELHLPIVVLDDEIDGVQHDSVTIDQREGALAMMRHLVEECGAKRVFFVGGLETNIDTQARYKAYRDTLRKAGLKFSKMMCTTWITRTSRRIGWRWTTCAIGRGRGTACSRPTTKWRRASSPARTPRRLPCRTIWAVVGFDDTRMAQMTKPLLTTVRVPMSSMGAKAVELLCQRIADPDRPPTKVSLNAELVVRESCGCDKQRTSQS